MKLIIKDRTYIEALADYATIIISIASFNTVWEHAGFFGASFWVRIISSILVSLIAIFKIVSNNQNNTRVFTAITICTIMSILSFIANSDISSTVLNILPIITALLFTSSILTKDDMIKFMERYVNIVTLLALLFLLFYIFGTCLHIISPNGSVVYQWDWRRYANSYFNIYYEPIGEQSSEYFGIRNYGVFVEPPMLNFVLCIALAAEMFLPERKRWKSIVLVMSALSTFSTTGFVAITIVTIYKYIASRQKSRMMNIVRHLSVPIALIISIFLLEWLIGSKSTTGSYGVRFDHLTKCFNIFITRFPLGTGFGNISPFMDAFYYKQGVSVGMVFWLAQAGLAGLFLYISIVHEAIKTSVYQQDYGLTFFHVVLMWLFFVTIVGGQLLFWIVLVCTSLFGDMNTTRKKEPKHTTKS